MKDMIQILISMRFAFVVLGVDAQAANNDYASKSYGIFAHYGWGGADTTYGCEISQYDDGYYPQSLEVVADSFDVQGFVDDLAAMSPEYLIFTIWHCGMNPLYPSEVVKNWLGEEHRSQRDVMRELLEATAAKGIDVYFYTQPSAGNSMDSVRQEIVDFRHNSTYTETYNNFINELYAEFTARYQDLLKGFWFDKGLGMGSVDGARLGETIKAIMPDAVMIKNGAASDVPETVDFGSLEIMNLPGNFNRYLDSALVADGFYSGMTSGDARTWPGFERAVALVVDKGWYSIPGSLRYTSLNMYQYTVLQAGVNEEGGGVAWALGPYPTTPVTWNTNVLTRMISLGAMIDSVGESIKGTVPSNSWPTAEGEFIDNLEWGVATRSADASAEYLHVLNPPSGATLTIDAPADGRVYIHAINYRTGNECTFSQTGTKLTITLHPEDSWHDVDAVIKLTPYGYTPTYNPPIYPPAPENVAFSGAATQSTTDYGGIASLAIDGNTNGKYNAGSVTHTETEANPWWQVDLGEDYTLGEINIYGRTDDCCADRLSDYTLYVMDSHGDTTYTEQFTTYPAVSTDVGGVQGRIVRIVLNTATYALNLAEVEVFTPVEAPVSRVMDSPEFSQKRNTKIAQISNNDLMIQVPDSKASRYVVYNTMGERVVSGMTQGQSTVLDVSGMHPGVYLVKVNSAVQMILKR